MRRHGDPPLNYELKPVTAYYSCLLDDYNQHSVLRTQYSVRVLRSRRLFTQGDRHRLKNSVAKCELDFPYGRYIIPVLIMYVVQYKYSSTSTPYSNNCTTLVRSTSYYSVPKSIGHGFFMTCRPDGRCQEASHIGRA